MKEKLTGPYRLFRRSDFAAGTQFEPRPTALVLVAALEIVVKDQHGHHLLLISPRYEDVEVTDGQAATLPENRHWTVPFVSKSFLNESGGYKDVAATLQYADSEAKKWNPTRQLTAYAQAQFRGIATIKLIDTFYELKRSWSQPAVTKLYRIMRYRAELGNCEASTFADPHSRKGVVFIPIDDLRYQQVTRPHSCKVHVREETLFLSTPLESNVSVILNDPERRSELRSHPLHLDREVFFTEYRGLLICGDIAGYGAASSYADDHMSDLGDENHGAMLRDSASVAFTELFLEAGVAQVHTAGDGFICAIPLASGARKPRQKDVREALTRFLTAYRAYIARLEKLNGAIARHAAHNSSQGAVPTMGSRLAIHFGSYRYGKMSQAASLLTGFDGREIVVVTRLEQGLRTVAHDRRKAHQHKIETIKHLLVASPEVLKATGRPPLPEIGRIKAISKEFSGEAILLDLSAQKPFAQVKS